MSDLVHQVHPLEYRSWIAMRQRCLNPKAPEYKNYGGRGITICARWENFYNFLYDMGPRPSKELTLDRINNNEGYFPGNCRWATVEEQFANRRVTAWVEFNGEKYPMATWAKKMGLSRQTLRQRLKAGWGIERALTTKDGRVR